MQVAIGGFIQAIYSFIGPLPGDIILPSSLPSRLLPYAAAGGTLPVINPTTQRAKYKCNPGLSFTAGLIEI